MNDDSPIALPEGVADEPPPSPPGEEQSDLTTIAGIDREMRKVMEQISNGHMDPLIGHNILASFNMLRDGILKQLKAKSEEAFSQAKKDQIDKEMDETLIAFVDDYRRIKRNQKPATKEEEAQSNPKTKKANGATNGKGNGTDH